nr:unnamed protein product [Callosobruchus analis]
MMKARDKAYMKYKKLNNITTWNYCKEIRNYVTRAIEIEKKAYLEYALKQKTSRLTWGRLRALNILKPRIDDDIPEHLNNLDRISEHFLQFCTESKLYMPKNGYLHSLHISLDPDMCTKIKDVVAKCIAENTGLMWFCDKCSDKVSEKLANLHTDASSSSIAELQVTRKENECLHREIQLMKKILADQDYVISLQKQTIENRESKIITQDQDIVNKPIVSSAKNKKISYRDIAARNKNKNQLVLTPVDKSKGVDMQKEVRRLLNPGELQVNIDSVKTTAVGNVVISCDSEDSLNKIKSSLESKCSGEVRMHLPKKILPKVCVKGISNKDLNKDDQAILAEIIARNGMQAYSEGFVRIVKKLDVKNRNGYSDVVIEVSHPVRDIIVRLQSEEDVLIVAVSETWLQGEIQDSEIHIDGYTVIRQDRSGRGGGVAIYIKQNLKYLVINLDVRNFEILAIRLNLNNRNIIFATIYRPPGYTNIRNFLDEFDEIVSSFSMECDHLIITGDFNINMMLLDNLHIQWLPNT